MNIDPSQEGYDEHLYTAHSQSILGALQTAVMLADSYGNFRYANPAGVAFLGLDHDSPILKLSLEQLHTHLLSLGGILPGREHPMVSNIKALLRLDQNSSPGSTEGAGLLMGALREVTVLHGDSIYRVKMNLIDSFNTSNPDAPMILMEATDITKLMYERSMIDKLSHLEFMMRMKAIAAEINGSDFIEITAISNWLINDLGYQEGDVMDIGFNLSNLTHPDDIQKLDEHRKALKHTHDTHSVQVRLRCKSGTYKHFSMISFVSSKTNDTAEVIMIAEDISEKVAIEAQLERQLELNEALRVRLHTVFKHSPIGTLVVDSNGNILISNDSAKRFATSVIGVDLPDQANIESFLHSWDVKEKFRQGIQIAINGHVNNMELKMIDSPFEIINGRTFIFHFIPNNGEGLESDEVIIKIQDVTGFREEQAELAREAFYNLSYADAVTGQLEASSKELDFSIALLVGILKSHDDITAGHTERVRDISMLIAEHLGVRDNLKKKLYYGSLLHDVGKLGIPVEIVQKAGRLTHVEYEKMQSHVRFPWLWFKDTEGLNEFLDIPTKHHEKWDGTGYGGYDSGAKGFGIPFLARLFAIVDAHDAMRSLRPYKLPVSKVDVLCEIVDRAGKHFDPYLSTVFVLIMMDRDEDFGYANPDSTYSSEKLQDKLMSLILSTNFDESDIKDYVEEDGLRAFKAKIASFKRDYINLIIEKKITSSRLEWMKQFCPDLARLIELYYLGQDVEIFAKEV